MALAVEFEDLADGTGFTANVTGSDGGEVSVFYTPADRPWPGDPWWLGDTRTGDGAVVVAVPPRFYFVYAADAAGPTPPDRLAVTSGRFEPATLIQDAIAAVILTLALPSQSDYQAARTPADLDWVGVKVLTQLSEDAAERQYPCVTITAADGVEELGPGTNDQDDVTYRYSVMLFDTIIQDRHRGTRQWVQFCRSKISKAFRFQHTMGITTLVQAKVRYRQVFIRRQENIDGTGGGIWAGYAGGLTVECVNREPRGLGA